MLRTAIRGLLIIAFVLCSVFPASAYSLLQPQTWPDPFNPTHWPFTLIPVPEVATDPNGGTTYGMLFVFLFKNQQGDIEKIVAPDLNNNTDLGFGGAFRLLSYPSEDTQWYFIAGGHVNLDRAVDVFFSKGRTHEQWWSFEGRVFAEHDPTERFFGIGNDSRLGGESNYMTKQVYVRALFGWNINKNLQLALFLRPRYIRIGNGAFNNLPQTTVKYPTVKGIEGGSEIYNEIRASYDTRDSIDIPRSGGLALIYYGIADRRFMSSISYNRFGVDLHHYWNLGNYFAMPLAKRFTIAAHGYLQYIPAGIETPFWSMGRLGGYDSVLWEQQTLRGYGTGRFTDNNLSVANFELRTRVFEADVFGTHGIAEVAPFAEAGRVFHNMSGDPFTALHPVGGIGLRGIAEPFVVGYLDVGWGGEGTAVFTGVNYPF